MARNARLQASNGAASASGAPEQLTFARLGQNMKTMLSLVLAGGVITWLFISLLSMLNVTMMLLLPLGGWFADKAGERAGLVVGHLLFSAGYVLMLLGKRYAHFIVVWILYGIGASLLSPAYNSLISKAVPEKMRGTAYGLFSTSLGVISLPAPYIGGLMWRTLGPRAPFMVPMFSSLALAPLLWIKLGPGQGSAGSPAAQSRLASIGRDDRRCEPTDGE